MCQHISFFHNFKTGELKLWDTTSHSATQEHFNLNLNQWGEGHYLPSGEVICRVNPDSDVTQEFCSKALKEKYPTFNDFLRWVYNGKKELVCSENLDVSGCDLKGVKLPVKVGSLYVSGCDLKGVKLPAKVKVYK